MTYAVAVHFPNNIRTNLNNKSTPQFIQLLNVCQRRANEGRNRNSNDSAERCNNEAETIIPQIMADDTR